MLCSRDHILKKKTSSLSVFGLLVGRERGCCAGVLSGNLGEEIVLTPFTDGERGASARLVPVAHPGQVRAGDPVRRLHFLALGTRENKIPPETPSQPVRHLLESPKTSLPAEEGDQKPPFVCGRTAWRKDAIKCLTSDSPRHIEVRRRRERTQRRALSTHSHFFVLRFCLTGFLRVDSPPWIFTEGSEVLRLVFNPKTRKIMRFIRSEIHKGLKMSS